MMTTFVASVKTGIELKEWTNEILGLPALDDARLGLSGFTQKLFHPERDLFSHTNRACPIANAANRLDNHGHWIRNRVASKAEWLFLPLFRAVNHAGVTARGFVWLTVSREIPKAPNSSHLNDVSSNRNPLRFLFATD